MPYATVIDKIQTVRLRDLPTGAPKELNKEKAVSMVADLGAEMEELFDLMYFAGQNSLLIVLQGMDTSGKDGIIRHVLSYAHAQTCRVAPFKVPTEVEAAHDFLWRIHQQTPQKGEIGVFNRSHYEDVLVVRVHKFVPETVWKDRFGRINDFEELLVKSNTIVQKFFLHLSKDEQEQRLLEREKDPKTAWKLSVGDWTERELWSDYEAAYEDAIGKCASKDAPWNIVAADKKWFRNLAVTEAIVLALRPYKKVWMKDLEEIGAKAKAELAAYRKSK